MRESINVAIIKDTKILLVKKEKSWLLPGGKPNPDESDIECLCREVYEELSGTLLKDIEFYGEFIGKTHTEERFKTKVYFANIKGKLKDPSAEISESEWVQDTNKYDLSDMNLKVIKSLIKDGYLKSP